MTIVLGRSAEPRLGSGTLHPVAIPISATTLAGRSRAAAMSSAGSRLDAPSEPLQAARQVEVDHVLARAGSHLQAPPVRRERLGGHREELQDGWLDQQHPRDEVGAAEQEIERHDRSNAGTDDDGRRRLRGLEQDRSVLALLLHRGPPVALGRGGGSPAPPVVADRAGPRSERLAHGVPDPAVGGGLVDEQDWRALSSLAPHDLDAAGLEGGHAVPRCCARPG